jgi:hypothetical protein
MISSSMSAMFCTNVDRVAGKAEDGCAFLPVGDDPR